MTTSAPAGEARGGAPTPGAAGELVEQVVALTKLVHGLRTRELSRSAHTLLFPLLAAGPLRVTALAEAVHVDPSTTSRQVAELERAGLVVREGDPDDRRASRIAVSAAGRAEVARMRQRRAATTARALAAWDPADLTAFTTLLRRFTDDLATHLAQEDR